MDYLAQKPRGRVDDSGKQISQQCIVTSPGRNPEHGVEKPDQLNGRSMISPNEGLSTSTTQLVLDLLQNADTNSFIQAREHKQVPEVSFAIYPNRIVVECNGDGFSGEPLTATHKFREKSDRSESILKMAEGTHNQSGPFSLFPQPCQGGRRPTMATRPGMASQEHKEHSGDRSNRITLFFQEEGAPEELARQKRTISQQFRGIEETILLFMRSLERITVVFFDTDKGEEGQKGKKGDETRDPAFTITHSIGLQKDTRVSMTKVISRMGCDRQKNHHLAVGIANAFIKAIIRFRGQDTVPCQMVRVMRHLSDGGDRSLAGSVWNRVIRKVNEQVMARVVLLPTNQELLQLIRSSTSQRESEFNLQVGSFFPGTATNAWLSLRCQAAPLARPNNIDLSRTLEDDIDDLIVQARHDLAAAASTSRLKSTSDREYQTQVAAKLHLAFTKSGRGWRSRQKEIKELRLLPLREGDVWTSTAVGPVYYPKVEGTSLHIPYDLGLRVVDPGAVDDPDRKRLCDAIGVRTASTSFVRDAILMRHQRRHEMDVYVVLYHLRFLYLTWNLVDFRCEYPPITTLGEPTVGLRIRHKKIYRVGRTGGPDRGSPERHIRWRRSDEFIPKAYFVNPPAPPTPDSQPWEDWIRTIAAKLQPQQSSQMLDHDNKARLRLSHVAMEDPTSRMPGAFPPVAADGTLNSSDIKLSTAARDLDEDVIKYEDVMSPIEQPDAGALRSATTTRPPRPRTPEDGCDRLLQPLTPRRRGSDTSSDSEDLGRETPPSSVKEVPSPSGPRDLLPEESPLKNRTSHAGSRPKLSRMDAATNLKYKPAMAAMLHKVVEAGSRAKFPTQGIPDPPVHAVDLPREAFGLSNTDIGVAGELFVLEMLSNLVPSLPGFSRDNWRSTIRGNASLHPKYPDLSNWIGKETADITYDDEEGAFTSLLIREGYLDPKIWTGARVKYFLEVKTTLFECKRPFYMNESQYELMQKESNNNSATALQTDGIYVVFRVFNLGTDSPGVRVLVDLESMKQRREAKFEQKWSVVVR